MPQNSTSASNEPTESSTSVKPARRAEWNEVWMQMANVISRRSRCDRAEVGCIIVDEDQNILAAAYNGPAPGWVVPESKFVTSTCNEWCPRAQGIGGTTSDYSNCPSNHAEINAIARMTPTTKHTRAYVNRLCCVTCAKALAAAGVSMVMCQKTDIDGHIDTTTIRNYLESCDIVFIHLTYEEIVRASAR
jgi:dCMP deaminase